MTVRAMSDEPTVVKAEPTVVKADTEPISSAPKELSEEVKTGNAIDPADGSIAYGAALGDTDIVGSTMSIFKGGKASEVLNGRAAMVGFTAALLVELTSGESLFSQMFNLRDVGIRTLWLPKLVSQPSSSLSSYGHSLSTNGALIGSGGVCAGILPHSCDCHSRLGVVLHAQGARC